MISISRPGTLGSITAALLVSVAFVQPLSAETLTEALAKAYTTNPELLAERAALRATDEGVPQALSGWRPTVTVVGEAGKIRIDSNTSTTERDPRVLELQIRQPLYRGGRTVAQTRRAEAAVAAGRARLQATEQSVLLAAVRAYMNVLRDLAVVELTRNNEQRLQRQLDAAGDRFRVGEITRTDVSQAEARRSRATSDRIQAEGALVASRAVYRSVVGDMPGTLSADIAPLNLPANEEEAQARARDGNPDVVRARYVVESTRHLIDSVRGELLPRLDLTGSVGAEEETTARGARRDVAEITATLTVPLYEAGGVYSRLREAKQSLTRSLEEQDAARRSALEEATRAWNTLVTARAAVQAFESAARANEIALEGVQRENLVGSRTILDVLDAEQELLDAQVSLVRSRRDEVVARFELLAAIGTLTAEGLNLPVEVYDPTVHYRDVRDRWFGTGEPVPAADRP